MSIGRRKEDLGLCVPSVGAGLEGERAETFRDTSFLHGDVSKEIPWNTQTHPSASPIMSPPLVGYEKAKSQGFKDP